jgi:hypothetical protein
MLKAYSLQEYEINQNRELEEERRNLLVQFGSLTLEMEGIRGRMTNFEARQRAFLNSLAQRHQATDYNWLRVENNQLVGDFMEHPQQQAATAPPPSDPPALNVERINGRG